MKHEICVLNWYYYINFFYTQLVKWLVIEPCQLPRYSDYSGSSAMFTQEIIE